MTESSLHAKEIESAFIEGVASKIHAAGKHTLPGSWHEREDADCEEPIREEILNRFGKQRDVDMHQVFADMPHGRGFTIRGFRRRWLFWKHTQSVTIATVLAPLKPLLDGVESPPRVSRSQLEAHIEGLIKNRNTPHLIGVCSPSGFGDDIYHSTPVLPPLVRLVLIEPRDDGGWRVTSCDERLEKEFVKLFDPEDLARKKDRVRRMIDERSSDLLSSGISAKSLAESLSLPVPLVNAAMREEAEADPELHLSEQTGGQFLFRGAAVYSEKEADSMSLAEWIKSLFSKEGEEVKKINVLSERRASLSQRLDRMYEDIGELETKEGNLIKEGKATKSKVSKRRIAAQVSRLRKDISRHNTSAAMLSKQINIISTHVHNLELSATGTVAELPSSDELTEAAVNAEEMLEQLNASDDLVSSLEVGMAESAVSDDEAAILAELEEDVEEEGTTESGLNKQAETTEPARKSNPSERGEAQAE